MKKYYKVVRGNMESARAYWTINGIYLPVKYKLNKWVYPNLKHTDLMVFKYLSNAKAFMGPNERLFECEVKTPRKQGNLIYDSNISVSRVVLEIIKNRQQKKKWTHLVASQARPAGTVFCSAVKLTKEIT